MPCSHAMAFIFHKNESLDAYLPDALKMETQIAAYCEAMPPISIAGLKPAMDDNADSDDEGLGQTCNLPMTHVPHGQPRKIWQDKGNYRTMRGVGTADLLDTGDGHQEKRIVLCGMCGEEGHYSTTCHRAHN